MAKRRMTTQDQWDLVLFLAILVAALMGGAILWKAKGTTKIAAYATNSPSRVATISDAQIPDLTVSQSAKAPFTDLLAPIGNPLPLPNDRLATPAASVDVDNTAYTSAAPAKTPAKVMAAIKYFGGEKYHYLKTIHMRVTAYAPDPRCCWPFPGTTTASGLSVKTNKGKLVAADTNVLPFHSLVSVPGYHGGETVPVLDRGAAIKGHKLDVLLPTFEMAQGWGAKTLDVKVYVAD